MRLRRVEADRGERQPHHGPITVVEQPGDQAAHCHRRAGGGQVPPPLVLAIGITAPNDHADGPEHIGDGGGKASLHVRQTELLDDLRGKHRDPDADAGLAEMDCRKRQHAWVKERLEH